MKTKLKKYKAGGADTSLGRYKKYQTAGVYSTNQLNTEGVNPNTEQFRYKNPNQQVIANYQNVADNAQQDYDQGMDEYSQNAALTLKKEQLANTSVGMGLGVMNKGNMGVNFAAQKTFKTALKNEMAKGVTKDVAMQNIAKTSIANPAVGTAGHVVGTPGVMGATGMGTAPVMIGQQAVTKPMAQGLLGTGTATVGMSNAINVGSLVGTIGGGMLERAWDDDDATTYTTKEGIAGALKRGSSWAGYGNMILPGVGGLIGGAAGVVSSIFSGKKKARKARDKEKELKKEFLKKRTRALGSRSQIQHQAQQQVGTMMGNKMGGVRQYALGGIHQRYGHGGAQMRYNNGGLQMRYNEGGLAGVPSEIAEGPIEVPTVPIINGAGNTSSIYDQGTEMRDRMETFRKDAEEKKRRELLMQEPNLQAILAKQRSLGSGSGYEMPNDMAYAAPDEEMLRANQNQEQQLQYQNLQNNYMQINRQMGGFQAPPPQELMRAQQYQQPFVQSNNLPYRKGGLLRY